MFLYFFSFFPKKIFSILFISTTCNFFILTVNGGWGEWSSWSSCLVRWPSNQLAIKPEHVCDNPIPQYGGSSCPGTQSDSQNGCNSNIDCQGMYPAVLLTILRWEKSFRSWRFYVAGISRKKCELI